MVRDVKIPRLRRSALEAEAEVEKLKAELHEARVSEARTRVSLQTEIDALLRSGVSLVAQIDRMHAERLTPEQVVALVKALVPTHPTPSGIETRLKNHGVSDSPVYLKEPGSSPSWAIHGNTAVSSKAAP